MPVYLKILLQALVAYVARAAVPLTALNTEQTPLPFFSLYQFYSLRLLYWDFNTKATGKSINRHLVGFGTELRNQGNSLTTHSIKMPS